MKGDTLDQLIHKLQHVKKSEALCGLHIDRRDPLAADGERLIAEIEHVFETVMPLYRLAYQI